ncbi:MAG: LysM peptidoglycan-binding domain-containing protein [Bacteroidaceae bacterium]|nr:LysM peptidoglycan-binding domain-containing protein [Bacteroidaceae bacterium]
MKKLLFLFLLSFFCTPVFSQDLVPMRGKIKDGYDFWLYEPKGWDVDTIQKPLVLFLHGASLCGRNLDRVRRYGTLDALDRGRMIDAFVLAPQNPGGAWKPSKIMDVVNWVSDNFQVDTNRIYVLGMSLGGYGTIDFAATYPDKIAAAMAICGGGTVKNYEPLNSIPLWILHGTADKAVPISHSDKVVEAMNKNGEASRLIYTRLKGLNHGRPARIFYLKETYEWLFLHSLLDEGRPVNKDYQITPERLRTAYSDLGRKGHLSVSSSVDKLESESQQQQEVADEIASAQYYKVRSGDNLSSIAKRHKISVVSIRNLNNLKSDRLSIGQRLRIR